MVDWIQLQTQILFALHDVEKVYYPILIVVGVPANIMTIIIFSRRKCGLSKNVTRYLVAMAAADLLVIIIDLILRHIPIVFWDRFLFVESLHVCNIHASFLFAASDCSVWFTVSFTFDRFVSICCQKLKTKHCTGKMAAAVLGTVTALSCLKNISWYFMLSGQYWLLNNPWFCNIEYDSLFSRAWGAFETLHYILTPGMAFVMILLFNGLTVRHISVVSKARRRLRGHNSLENSRDPEMDNRRKSIILLFLVSGNFILLWSILAVHCLWNQMWYFGFSSETPPNFVQEIGFMLQLLSCCTNTFIYALTQTKFREHLQTMLRCPPNCCCRIHRV
ncbi:probable G-protein coupled receptor 139 [Leucoraja erinacea]|uniref:probable G-protein coupled receptor 139 n=1 Tax=Leucoraja erinaceus TaxID=7782 RepID=UPI002458EA71|nr:probable G-protein coupled receptor 139 [Leucoraja erinacea]